MPKFEYMVPAGAGRPVWSGQDKTRIDITVSFPHLGGEEVRYTASMSDPEWEHSEEIFARAAAGEFGKVGRYVPPPVMVPTSVSDRQFFQALAKLEIVSLSEALAAVKTGDLPDVLEQALAALPADQQFDARMLFEGSTVFDRNHASMVDVTSGMGWSRDKVDNIFRLAASL